MKLGEFIEKLEKIEKEHGESIEVKMADGIPVVNPVYLKNFIKEDAVVITDEE